MAAADRARDVPVVVAGAGPAEALTEDLNGRLPHAWLPAATATGAPPSTSPAPA